MADQAKLLTSWINQSHIPVKCYTTSSMRETIDFLTDIEVDAVLLDLGLPDSNGIGTLHRLRYVIPDTPVVIVGTTSECNLLHVEKQKGNITEYICKPPAELHMLVSVTNALLPKNSNARQYTHRDLHRIERIVEDISIGVI
jgi:DNA-binding response OmpR family regulator